MHRSGIRPDRIPCAEIPDPQRHFQRKAQPMSGTKHLVHAIAGVLLLLHGWSAAQSVQLTIDSARFEPSTHKLVLSMKANNTSEDFVRILRPEPLLIDKHYVATATPYIGLQGRPYKLSITKTGTCAKADAAARAPATPGKAILLTKLSVAVVAPHSQFDLGSIELDVDGAAFCSEAKYSFQLSYEPSFELPTKESTDKVAAYIKARKMEPETVRGLLPENARFLADQGWLPENAKLFSGAKDEPPSLERYLESVKLIESLDRSKIASNAATGLRFGAVAKAAEATPAPKAAKTAKKK